jgi:hypothetical protein
MERNELVQTLTLWFVVLIFLRTASGTTDSQVLDAIGIGAILLLYLLPSWILVELVSDFLASQ